MSIKIGHASIDEKGKAKNGQSGDQTGKEVFTRNWYDGDWAFLARAKDPEVAREIAKAAAAGCANDNIGYDQNQRNTLLTRAKAVGWDLAKIDKPCESDCSSFVTCCVQAAGIEIWSGGNAPTTSNLKTALKKTNAFDILTDAKYLNSGANLLDGDILVRPKTSKRGGHTVIIVDGAEAPATAPVEKPVEPVPTFSVGSVVRFKDSATHYYPGGSKIPDWVRAYDHIITQTASKGKPVYKGKKISVLLGKKRKTSSTKVIAGITTWVDVDTLELV